MASAMEASSAERTSALTAVGTSAATAVAKQASATSTAIAALAVAHGMAEDRYRDAESKIASTKALKTSSREQYSRIEGQLEKLDDIEAAMDAIETSVKRMDDVTKDLEAALKSR